MARREKAPPAHEWRKVSSKTWHCRWCDGYIRTVRTPSPEDRPTEHAREMFAIVKPHTATKASQPEAREHE